MIKVEGKASRRFWGYRWRSVIQPILVGVLITVIFVPVIAFLKSSATYVDRSKPFTETIHVVRAVSVLGGKEKDFHYAGQIELDHVAVVGVSQTPISPGEVMVAS